MVSPMPMKQDVFEEPFAEAYYPRQMSWYAPEGPQGLLEAGARFMREKPWAAIGIAAGIGLLAGLLAIPRRRERPIDNCLGN